MCDDHIHTWALLNERDPRQTQACAGCGAVKDKLGGVPSSMALIRVSEASCSR